MNKRFSVPDLLAIVLLSLLAPSARAQSSSPFQDAIYYNGLLEFSTCANMTVNGRVYCGSNIYVGAATSASLIFGSQVSAVGTFTAPDNNGTSWATGANVYTYNATTWRTYFTNGASYVTNVSMSTLAVGTNISSLLSMPPAGENLATLPGAARLYNQAQTILIISNNAAWMKLQTPLTPGQLPATDPSPLWLGAYTNLSGIRSNLAFLTLTNIFYDAREGKTNLVTQIDVGVFSSWLKTNALGLGKFATGGAVTNYPTILYVADTRSSNNLLTVVRLTNGLVLPKNGGQGWTVVTPNPLYVWGNYNCTNTADLGTTNTASTLPAALMSDALTLLSSNWKDTNSLKSTYLASNTNWDAAPTNTINAAILTGNVPSTGTSSTTFSGGVQNLPRLLEDWSSSDLWLNTSLVCLYKSNRATNQWQTTGTYYAPPTRHFNLDLNFTNVAKLPPGSLTLNSSAPTITLQPQGQTVAPGAAVLFSAMATGSPIAYQWTRNGTNLAGANTNQLFLNNVQSGQVGTYAVRVTNYFGSTVVSSNAVLIINSNLTVTVPATVNESDGVLANAGNVSIAGPVVSNLTVLLLSQTPSRLHVPASTVIPAGNTNATFDITIVSNTVADGSPMVMVYAGLTHFVSNSAPVTILDDDADHFDISSITSPQTPGVPFLVTISARDASDALVTNYPGTANLSAVGNGGSVGLSPSTASGFVSGQWTGNITLNAPDTAVFLTATDTPGATGSSNPFDVATPVIRPTLNSPSMSAEGGLQFDIAGSDGLNYAVETSSNLLDWTSIFTNMSPFTFTDTNTVDFPMKFYRSHQVP